LRLAALEILPQRRAQAALLPDLRCALGTIVHRVEIMYRGRPEKGLGRDDRPPDGARLRQFLPCGNGSTHSGPLSILPFFACGRALP
jgi:hypothetical protein